MAAPDADFDQFIQLAATGAAPKPKLSGADLMDALQTAHHSSVGLSNTMEATKALIAKGYSPAEVHEQMKNLSKSGVIELQPESGMNRYKPDELKLAPFDIFFTGYKDEKLPLTWARFKDVAPAAAGIAAGAAALGSTNAQAAANPLINAAVQASRPVTGGKQTLDPNQSVGQPAQPSDFDKFMAAAEEGGWLRAPKGIAGAVDAVAGVVQSRVKAVGRPAMDAFTSLPGVSPSQEYGLRQAASGLLGPVEEQGVGRHFGSVEEARQQGARDQQVLTEGRQTVGAVGTALMDAFANTPGDGVRTSKVSTPPATGLEVGDAALKHGALLPVYAMPGLGEGAMEMISAGALSELFLDRGKPSEGALAGAAFAGAGALVKGAKKLGSKAAAEVKGGLGGLGGILDESTKLGGKPLDFGGRQLPPLEERLPAGMPTPETGEMAPIPVQKSKFIPVGYTPQPEVKELARQLADAPAFDPDVTPAASPKSLAADAAGPRPAKQPTPATSVSVIDRDAGGGLVVKEVALDAKGGAVVTSTKPIANLHEKVMQQEHATIATPEAMESPEYHDFIARTYSHAPAQASKVDLSGKLGTMPDGKLAPGMDYRPDLTENGVVVVAYGDGALGIHDIKSRFFKRESLKERGLVEFWDASAGEWKRGYIADLPNEGISVLAPDPKEGIPGAVLTDQRVPAGARVKQVLDERKLDDIIDASELTQARGEAEAALLADPAARVDRHADGTPIELPPLHPPAEPAAAGLPVLLNPRQSQIMADWAKGLPRVLFGSHSRGVIDAAQLAITQYSLQQAAFKRVAADVYADLVNKFGINKMPEPLQKSFAADLNSYLRALGDGPAEPTLVALQQKYPAMAQASTTFFEDARRALNARHQRIVDLGGVSDIDPMLQLSTLADPESTAAQVRSAENNLRSYSTLMYNRFMLEPGEWYDIARRDQANMRKWKDWVRTEIVDKNTDWRTGSDPDGLAQYFLDDMLGRHDGIERQTNVLNRDFIKSLQHRKDIDPMIAEILGESNNGVLRLATSISRQEAAIANLSVWHEVSLNADVFLPMSELGNGRINDLTYGPWRQLPDSALYGHARGGMLRGDYYEALIDAPAAVEGAHNMALKVVRWVNKQVKFSQVVLRPAAFLNQIQGNISGILMTGASLNPASMARHMTGMLGDYKAYRAGITTLRSGASNPAAERFVRAIELFGTFGSFAKSEATQAEKFLEKALRKGSNPVTSVADLTMAVADHLGAAQTKLGNIFSIPDEVSKYSSWTSLLEKGGIDLKTGTFRGADGVSAAKVFLGQQFGLGAKGGLEELAKLVEREAARRIHLSFPMLDRTSKGVRTAQTLSGVVINPYLGVKTEMLRTYMMLAKRLYEGEPGLRAHTMKAAAVVAGFWAANRAAQHANGLTDKQINDAWSNMPATQQQYNPQLGARPTGNAKADAVLAAVKPGPLALWWRDAKGRPQFWDMNALVEPLTYLQGDPEASALGRILGNTVMMPWDGSMAEPEVRTALRAVGIPIAPSYEQPIQSFRDKGAALADRAINQGLVPFGPFAEQTYRTVNGVGNAANMTAGQKAAKLAGARVLPGGTPDIKAKEKVRKLETWERGMDAAGNPAYARPRGLVEGTPTVQENLQRQMQQMPKEKKP